MTGSSESDEATNTKTTKRTVLVGFVCGRRSYRCIGCGRTIEEIISYGKAGDKFADEWTPDLSRKAY